MNKSLSSFAMIKPRLNWPKISIRLNISLLIFFVSSFSALELLSGAIFALNKRASTSSVFCLVGAVTTLLSLFILKLTVVSFLFLTISDTWVCFLVLPSLGKTSIVLQDVLLELSLAWPKSVWLVLSKRSESISCWTSFWELSSSSSDSLTEMISSLTSTTSMSVFLLTVHCYHQYFQIFES